MLKQKARFLLAVLAPVIGLAIFVEAVRRVSLSAGASRVAPPVGLAALPEAKGLPRLAVSGQFMSPFDLKDPVNLLASGDWLVVLDPFGEARALAFGTTTGEWVNLTPYLQLDSGRQLSNGGADTRPGSFLLRNPSQGNVIIQLSLPLRKPPTPSLALTSSPGRGAGFVIGGHTDALAWGTQFSPDALLHRFRRAADRLEMIGAVGSTIFPEFAGASVARGLNRNSIALDRVNGRLAQAFLFSNRLHLYDENGHLDRIVAGPFDTRLIFNTAFDLPDGEPRFVMAPETRFAYLDVTANESMVFALYSGRQTSHPFAAMGDEVHVFSWDGRFVGRWKLPQAVRRLKLAGTPERLWGLRIEPSIVLQAFDPPPARNY